MAGLLLDPGALVAQALLIEHVVCLVNNEDLQLGHVELSSSNQVHDRARSSTDNTGADGSVSRDDTGDRGSDIQLLAELTDRLYDALDLAGQLTAGSQNQRLGLGWLAEVEARQNGCDEGCCLAGARL